jgi:hypothetical protein
LDLLLEDVFWRTSGDEGLVALTADKRGEEVDLRSQVNGGGDNSSLV